MEFCDVTLVNECNQQKEANKVILSEASLFFRFILMTKKYSHPLMYMRGIKDNYLIAIINVIYN